MARPEVDMELKRAFAAQQAKLIETRQKLKLSDLQIDALNKGILRCRLTDREIASLPDDTKTYESIGRMFALRTIPEVRKTLDIRIKSCEDKIKTLENNKTYLDRNLKESENNLREMVQQRREMAAQLD